MQITIIKPDNFVTVDGVQKEMDLTFLPEDFHALHWSNGSGFVESIDIDKCQKLQNISDWSLWSDFDVRLRDAKNTAGGGEPQIESAVEEDAHEPEEITDEILLQRVRGIRDSHLVESDVDIIRFLEAGQPIPTELKQYRQSLRDLPNQIESGTVPLPNFNEEDQTIEYDSWTALPVKPLMNHD